MTVGYFYMAYEILGITYTLTGASTAYLLYASDNNQNFKISRLDADYYNVVTQTSVLSGTSTPCFCFYHIAPYLSARQHPPWNHPELSNTTEYVKLLGSL